MMGKALFLWIGVFFIALSGGGGCNIFNDMSIKTSDAAIIDDVNNYIDQEKYSDAIGKWSQLSPAGQTVQANLVLLATAYAGRGGLDVINLANNLQSANSPTFFIMVMQAFKGSVITNFNDEVTAESIMLGISKPAAGRTADENMFMLFLEMAKLGTLFATIGDVDADGVLDAGFDSCVNATALEAEHVATGVSIIMDTLTAISSSIVSGAASVVTAQCAVPPLAGTQFCTGGLYFPADVTALERQIAQTLIGENNLNIGLQAPTTKNVCELSGGGNCHGTFTPFCP